MGIVRYKEPSSSFEKMAGKTKDTNLRVSLGREQSVKEYYYISTSNLIPYGKQARKRFNKKEIEELAATIKEHGIRSPLQVISSSNNSGKFEVISGERRLRAALFIGLEKVPCIIIRDTDKVEEIGLIENIQRADLHPIELANGLASLMEKYNWGDINKLAEKIGKSQSTISEHLSYAKLPPEIKEHLIEKDIRSRDVLRKLINLKDNKEMANFLGFHEKNTVKNLNISKNILRVSFDDLGFKIQDKSLNNLGREKLLALKEELIKVISKIDHLVK